MQGLLEVTTTTTITLGVGQRGGSRPSWRRPVQPVPTRVLLSLKAVSLKEHSPEAQYLEQHSQLCPCDTNTSLMERHDVLNNSTPLQTRAALQAETQDGRILAETCWPSLPLSLPRFSALSQKGGCCGNHDQRWDGTFLE